MSELILDRNLVLAAGAGSGKTHALVTVALGLYGGAGGRAPIDPTRVWAVTFTEKAAAELRGRIADRAWKLARGGGDLAAEPDLAKGLGARVVRPAEWERIARGLVAAPIGTFHSLCGQLLRGFAAEARLDPRFAILDERESRRLFERAREEVLIAELGQGQRVQGLVAELGDLGALREAIDFLQARLAEEGRDPASLLDGPAFDESRARSRLGDACGMLPLVLEPLTGCGHPRLQGAVEAWGRERSRIGACEVAEIARWYPAVAAVVGVSTGKGALPKDVKPIWDAVKAAWASVQDAFAATRQVAIARELVGLVDRIGEAYAAEKRRVGALDFSDLVRRTRDLLRDDLEVRREAKKRVGALLVDEFQDTNGLQLDLVRLLAEARDEERPATDCAALPLERAVFCAVGDRKQSIYEFRGADVALFKELTEQAREGRDYRLHALTRSWRSRPGLVHFANGIFEALLAPSARPYEVGWVPAEDALAPQRDEGGPWAEAPAVQLLESDPELGAEDRRPYEAALVADHVARLLSSGRMVEEKGGEVRPLRGADVALLLRAFTHLPLYQKALGDRGIPSLVVNGRGFHRSREVRDLGALLLVLADPWDRFASAAVLRSPFAAISDDALVLLHEQGRVELGRHGKGCAAELPADDAARVARIGALVARLAREVDRLGPAAVLRLAIAETGYGAVLAAAPGGEQRLANVEKLLGRLEAAAGISTLAAAQELLARSDDPDDRESPADVAAVADPRAVRILTVHASKGLEFPVVVLPELGAGDPPETSAVRFDRKRGLAIKPTDALRERLSDAHADEVIEEGKARRDAESRRLLYVAITRARDLLVLCGEKGTRGGKGTWRAMIDEALPRVEALVERVPRPPVLGSGSVAAEVPAVGAGDRAEGEKLVASVSPPPIRPAGFVAAVTELAELSRCERRYFYRIIAGLDEHGGAGPLGDLPEAGDDLPGLDRLARGQLAHRILECADLSLAQRDPAAAVAAVLAQEGLDAELPEVAAVAADAEAFLAGELGKKLASSPSNRVFRELPFALELQGSEGTRLALRGQIDLLFVDGDGAVHLIDYKHAKGGKEPEAYAFQLRTYALAASRILPGGIGIRAGIAWLRDHDALPRMMELDGAALAAQERELGRLAEALAKVRAERRWNRLDSPSRCGDCGFARRCWGEGERQRLAVESSR